MGKTQIPKTRETGLEELKRLLNDPELLRARNEAALRLLQGWLADESGYDERVWPQLKEALEANRMGERKLFSE